MSYAAPNPAPMTIIDPYAADRRRANRKAALVIGLGIPLLFLVSYGLYRMHRSLHAQGGEGVATSVGLTLMGA